MVESPPRQRATKRVALSLDASKGADQDGSAAADINNIVGQYLRHGTMPAVQLQNPLFGDFIPPEDIHSTREALFAAHDRFLMKTPAPFRRRPQQSRKRLLRRSRRLRQPLSQTKLKASNAAPRRASPRAHGHPGRTEGHNKHSIFKIFQMPDSRRVLHS